MTASMSRGGDDFCGVIGYADAVAGFDSVGDVVDAGGFAGGGGEGDVEARHQCGIAIDMVAVMVGVDDLGGGTIMRIKPREHWGGVAGVNHREALAGRIVQ